MDKKLKQMLIAVLAVCFIADFGMAINPVIDTLAKAFPDIAYNTILYVATIASLGATISSFIFGFLTGRKISYRVVIIAGIFFMIVGGILPAFLSNFYVILICRLLFGFSGGLLVSIGSYIIRAFPEEHVSRVLGLYVTFMNIGSVLGQMISGFLADLGWRYSFLVYAIAIIPLIFALKGLKEPPKEEITKGTTKEKIKIPALVWIYMIITALTTILLYPMILTMSTFFDQNGYGTAAVAGIVVSCYTIGGALGGILYPYFVKYTKRFVLSTIILISCVGQVLVIWSGNVYLIALGILLGGLGFYPVLSLFPDWCGYVCDKNSLQLGCSLIQVSCLSAAFIVTYWMGMFEKLFPENVLETTYIAGLIGYFAIAVIFAFVNPLPKALRNKQKTVTD